MELNFISDNLVEIGAFYGTYVMSPNKKYYLAFDELKKKFIVFTPHTLIYKGSGITEFNSACIANNGSIIFASPINNKLGFILFAYDAHGSKILNDKFNSNILNMGLSEDGMFGCFQTCNSDDQFSSNKLFIISILENKIISRFSPKSGWADGYEFSIDNRILYLKYHDKPNRKYGYTINGDFVDLKEWERDITGVEAILRAEELLKEVKGNTPEDYKSIQALLNKGQFPNMDNNYKALFLKLQGLVHYKCNNLRYAELCFTKALELKDKIGVKRYLDRIRKSQNEYK